MTGYNTAREVNGLEICRIHAEDRRQIFKKLNQTSLVIGQLYLAWEEAELISVSRLWLPSSIRKTRRYTNRLLGGSLKYSGYGCGL